MRKGLIRFALSCFLLFPGLVVFGQGSRWDDALNRYERICEECIRLRGQALSGQAVSAADLNALLRELSDLRGTLRSAEGTMSPRQQDRFREIRQRYDALMTERRAWGPGLPGGLRAPRPRPAVPPRAASLARRFATPVAPPAPGAAPGAGMAPAGPGSGRVAAVPLTRAVAPAPWLTIAAFAGVPELSAGLLAAAGRGRFAALLKGSFTPAAPAASGECLSDGTLPGGGYVWTSGASRITRWNVAAGALWRVLPYGGVYAAAGYGEHGVRWQEAGGSWMEVCDLQRRGVCLDAGIIIPLGRAGLLAGVSTIAFRSLSADFGLAWSF